MNSSSGKLYRSSSVPVVGHIPPVMVTEHSIGLRRVGRQDNPGEMVERWVVRTIWGLWPADTRFPRDRVSRAANHCWIAAFVLTQRVPRAVVPASRRPGDPLRPACGEAATIHLARSPVENSNVDFQ